MDDLTEKQRMFCKEYIIDLNATQAAIRAGYSEISAGSIGNENMQKPEIQLYVQELIKKRSERLEITADMVLREYAKIAFIDIRKFYHESGQMKLPHELTDDAAASISGIELDEIWAFNPESEQKEKVGETKKVKMHSKVSALDSMAKHLGMFEKDNAQKQPLISPQIIMGNADKAK